MYDISQLNDMLVPELLDIAEQLSIPQAKKLEKKDLIYKIVDRQAETATDTREPSAEKSKRRRIVKATAANFTEEAEVMSGDNTRAEKEKENAKPTAAKRGRKPKTKNENEEQPQINIADTQTVPEPREDGNTQPVIETSSN